MALIDGMLQELEDEARSTRRLLERVPDNRLGWPPHGKSRTLGQLAWHIGVGRIHRSVDRFSRARPG